MWCGSRKTANQRRRLLTKLEPVNLRKKRGIARKPGRVPTPAYEFASEDVKKKRLSKMPNVNGRSTREATITRQGTYLTKAEHGRST